MSNNNQVIPANGNQWNALAPFTNPNLTRDFNGVTFITHPDGSKEAHADVNQFRCSVCDMSFPNQDSLNMHNQDWSRSCRRCGAKWPGCRIGWEAYNKHPYCKYTCAKHEKCFASANDAHEHARMETHTMCFWPYCTSRMAFVDGEVSYTEVQEHVARDHGYMA